MSDGINNKEEICFFKPFLIEYHKINVLDIGCGDGSFLSNVFNSMPEKISKIIGVDNNESDELELDIDEFLASSEENAKLKDNQIELIKMDGSLFLERLETEQDLIILSNVLHFEPWDKSRELIKSALKKLSDFGIVYIKVRKRGSKDAKHPFDENIIAEINRFSIILKQEEKATHYHLVIKRRV